MAESPLKNTDIWKESTHTHLLVKEDAEMAKNVAPDCVATALPIIVLPVPGGPKRSKPACNNEIIADHACTNRRVLFSYLLDKLAIQ